MVGFRDAGFDLGVDEGTGTSTPHAISPSLFFTKMDGTFAAAGNRFAYKHGDGRPFYYDADGNGGSSRPNTARRYPHYTPDPHGERYVLCLVSGSRMVSVVR